MTRRFLVVGAGFYGATMARLLSGAGRSVVVIEEHDAPGGHCQTRWNEEAGCWVHAHGPHIFHTDDIQVWNFVSMFAEFRGYTNRPRVRYRDRVFSFPINLMTLHQVFGSCTPKEARMAIEFETSKHRGRAPRNMEDHCLQTIGQTLYGMFIEGYTQKQWGRHPSELPASIVKRIPVRLTFDDNYFDHPYQGIPIGGYTALVRAIIPTDAAIYYDTPFEERMVRSYDAVIYTGAIDRYFDYALGPLEYRSLRFDNALYESDDHQGCAVMNYTDAAVPHTRVIEHRHFDPKARPTGFTYVTKETPVEWTPGLERFYPVPTERNQALYERYAALDRDPRVVFGGRLGTYRYMDMDKTIRAAMDKAQEILAA